MAKPATANVTTRRSASEATKIRATVTAERNKPTWRYRFDPSTSVRRLNTKVDTSTARLEIALMSPIPAADAPSYCARFGRKSRVPATATRAPSCTPQYGNASGTRIPRQPPHPISPHGPR